MKSNYKQLGRYIRPIDVRNKGLVTTKLLGISVEKCFIPSIANIIGTDLEKYKIVRKGQFAYIPDTSRRGDKIAVALLREEECIISSVYTAFEIIDTNELDPEYLMLWFCRPEFDRYARYHSHGSVREIFDWNEMCRVELPVPSIEKQTSIVRQINQCSDYVSNKTKLISAYEGALQALYKSYKFDEQDSPESRTWETCTIGDLCLPVGGGTPSTDEPAYYEGGEIPWVTPTDVTRNGCLALLSPKGRITELGLKHSSAKMLPPDTILMTSRASVGYFALCGHEICTNQGFISCIPNRPELRMYLLCNLINRVKEIRTLADGGSTYSEISKKDFKAMKVSLPPTYLLKEFECKAYSIFTLIRTLRREIESIKELRTTILSTL